MMTIPLLIEVDIKNVKIRDQRRYFVRIVRNFIVTVVQSLTIFLHCRIGDVMYRKKESFTCEFHKKILFTLIRGKKVGVIDDVILFCQIIRYIFAIF